MTLVRKRLPLVAAAWLTLQAVALFAAPIALQASVSATAAACDCTDAVPGQQCPMHHDRGHDSTHETARCGMSSAALPSNAALLTVVASGPVPSAIAAGGPSGHFEAVVTGRDLLSSRLELPDTPPPRA